MELIVDSAVPFCHCSFGVLKWLRTPLDSRNCIISSDFYSEALSRFNTTNLCLVRRSAISAYHVLNALIASSFVFIPYIHLYPVAASTKMIAWLYFSIDSTDDENESICIWYSGLLIWRLAFGKSSKVALPIIHDGHLVWVSKVIFFNDSKPCVHLIVSRIFRFEAWASLRWHSSYPDCFSNCLAQLHSFALISDKKDLSANL